MGLQIRIGHISFWSNLQHFWALFEQISCLRREETVATSAVLLRRSSEGWVNKTSGWAGQGFTLLQFIRYWRLRRGGRRWKGWREFKGQGGGEEKQSEGKVKENVSMEVVEAGRGKKGWSREWKIRGEMEGGCLRVENAWKRRTKKYVSEASGSARLQFHLIGFWFLLSSAPFHSSPLLSSVIRPASVRDSGNNQFSTDPVPRDRAPT